MDQQGTYVFIVEDGKAAVTRVKLGGEHGPVRGGGSGPQGRRAGDRPGDGEPAGWGAGGGQSGAAAAQPEPKTMFSTIFIDRPRLATVIAIVTTIAGLLSAVCHPDRAVSRHRAAAGVGDDDVSGRLGGGG